MWHCQMINCDAGKTAFCRQVCGSLFSGAYQGALATPQQACSRWPAPRCVEHVPPAGLQCTPQQSYLHVGSAARLCRRSLPTETSGVRVHETELEDLRGGPSLRLALHDCGGALLEEALGASSGSAAGGGAAPAGGRALSGDAPGFDVHKGRRSVVARRAGDGAGVGTLLGRLFDGALAVLLCYDTCDAESFVLATTTLYNAVSARAPSAFVVLLGCKVDDVSHRQVETSAAEAFAARYDMMFLETSAADGTNVQLAVTLLRIRAVALLRQRGAMPLPSATERRPVEAGASGTSAMSTPLVTASTAATSTAGAHALALPSAAGGGSDAAHGARSVLREGQAKGASGDGAGKRQPPTMPSISALLAGASLELPPGFDEDRAEEQQRDEQPLALEGRGTEAGATSPDAEAPRPQLTTAPSAAPAKPRASPAPSQRSGSEGSRSESVPDGATPTRVEVPSRKVSLTPVSQNYSSIAAILGRVAPEDEQDEAPGLTEIQELSARLIQMSEAATAALEAPDADATPPRPIEELLDAMRSAFPAITDADAAADSPQPSAAAQTALVAAAGSTAAAVGPSFGLPPGVDPESLPEDARRALVQKHAEISAILTSALGGSDSATAYAAALSQLNGDGGRDTPGDAAAPDTEGASKGGDKAGEAEAGGGGDGDSGKKRRILRIGRGTHVSKAPPKAPPGRPKEKKEGQSNGKRGGGAKGGEGTSKGTVRVKPPVAPVVAPRQAPKKVAAFGRAAPDGDAQHQRAARVIAKVEVSLPDGRKETMPIKEGATAAAVAREFVRLHRLSADKEPLLKQLVANRLDKWRKEKAGRVKERQRRATQAQVSRHRRATESKPFKFATDERMRGTTKRSPRSGGGKQRSPRSAGSKSDSAGKAPAPPPPGKSHRVASERRLRYDEPTESSKQRGEAAAARSRRPVPEVDTSGTVSPTSPHADRERRLVATPTGKGRTGVTGGTAARLNVDMGGGRSGTLVVHSGDDPKTVVEDFRRLHLLDDSMAAELLDAVRNTLRGMEDPQAAAARVLAQAAARAERVAREAAADDATFERVVQQRSRPQARSGAAHATGGPADRTPARAMSVASAGSSVIRGQGAASPPLSDDSRDSSGFSPQRPGTHESARPTGVVELPMSAGSFHRGPSVDRTPNGRSTDTPSWQPPTGPTPPQHSIGRPINTGDAARRKLKARVDTMHALMTRRSRDSGPPPPSASPWRPVADVSHVGAQQPARARGGTGGSLDDMSVHTFLSQTSLGAENGGGAGGAHGGGVGVVGSFSSFAGTAASGGNAPTPRDSSRAAPVPVRPQAGSLGAALTPAPPQTSTAAHAEAASAQRGMPGAVLLELEVVVREGQRGVIEVRQGDDVAELAQAFAEQHGLPATAIPTLAGDLQDALRQNRTARLHRALSGRQIA